MRSTGSISRGKSGYITIRRVLAACCFAALSLPTLLLAWQQPPAPVIDAAATEAGQADGEGVFVPFRKPGKVQQPSKPTKQTDAEDLANDQNQEKTDQPPQRATPTPTQQQNQRQTDPTPADQAGLPQLQPTAEDTGANTFPPIEELTVSDIRVAAFQGITPAKSTLAEVKQKFGSDDVISESDSQLSYKIGPFPQVDFAIEENLVASIVVHLAEPVPPQALEAELGLSEIHPAPVPDEYGDLLGHVYPERGILFSFSPKSKTPMVALILIEPVAVESFVIRAKYDFDHRYRHDLADLSFAQQHAPQHAESYWLKSDILRQIGRFSEALEQINRAVELEPDNSRYRLAKSRLIADRGDFAAAIQLTKAILDEEQLSDEIRARAHCQLGDLLAEGPAQDFKQALEHHLAAIKLAAKLVKEDRFLLRRRAKRVLVDAHLAVAVDIAAGNWRRKQEVVPKWLENAEQLTRQLVNLDRGDTMLELRVLKHKLMAAADIGIPVSSEDLAEAARRKGETLISQSQDPHFRHQLQWELATALYHAARIQLKERNVAQALSYASVAVELSERSAAHRESVPWQDYQMGRMYYLTGSIYAIDKKQHAEAMPWYDKARDRLSRDFAASGLSREGRLGDMHISMGVSYWRTGQHTLGLEMTQQGVKLLEQAITKGKRSRTALAVPYGNLAGMYQQLGDQKESDSFAAKAAQLRSSAGRRQGKTRKR